MPEFGVIFKFNADYDHVSWYGLGESETYADRKKGAKLGIYDNMVKDNGKIYGSTGMRCQGRGQMGEDHRPERQRNAF